MENITKSEDCLYLYTDSDMEWETNEIEEICGDLNNKISFEDETINEDSSDDDDGIQVNIGVIKNNTNKYHICKYFNCFIFKRATNGSKPLQYENIKECTYNYENRVETFKKTINTYLNEMRNITSIMIIMSVLSPHQTFNNCVRITVPYFTLPTAYFGNMFLIQISPHIAKWFVSNNSYRSTNWLKYIDTKWAVEKKLQQILKNIKVMFVDFSYFRSDGNNVITGFSGFKIELEKGNCNIIDYIQINIELQTVFDVYGDYEDFFTKNLPDIIFINNKFRFHITSTYFPWWKYFITNSDKIVYVPFNDKECDSFYNKMCINSFYNNASNDHKICSCCNGLKHIQDLLTTDVYLKSFCEEKILRFPYWLRDIQINCIQCINGIYFDTTEYFNNYIQHVKTGDNVTLEYRLQNIDFYRKCARTVKFNLYMCEEIKK